MDRRALSLSVLVLLLGSTPAGHAGPYEWLKDSPAGHFTNEDWRLMKGALQAALDSGRSGDRVAWRNPSSGHSGWIQAADRIDRHGMHCRRAKVFSSAAGLTSVQQHLFCREASGGQWKVAPPSP